jgi:hypothetical protein
MLAAKAVDADGAVTMASKVSVFMGRMIISI